MKRAFSVLSVLLLAGPGGAITWNFDTEGDTQGWVATEGNNAVAINTPRLASEVRDGVWRITPIPPSQAAGARAPIIFLSSPVIGRDSALFDRLRIRLRVVYTRPFEAMLMLLWRNSVNEGTGVPGLAPPADPASEYAVLTFSKGVGQVYTTDWQEVVVSQLRTEEFGGSPLKGKQVWEGELIEIALRLFLNEMSSPEDIPEAVEIDWIQLTGFEEQLQGEETPPPSESLPSFGDLFAAPVFSPLRGGVSSPYWVRMAALGDLDGDGHPDLLTRWEDPDLTPGWLSALNDGHGQFRTAQIEPLAQPLMVGGADLDGDGLMDLVLRDSAGLKVMSNRAEEGFVSTVLTPDVWYLGVGDAEGDGDVDLWTFRAADEQVTETVLQRNDGAGRFEPVSLGAELAVQGFVPFVLAHPVSQERTTGLLWVPVDDPGQGYRVTYLAGREGWVQEHLAVSVRPLMVRYAGDVDGDGDVDLVVSEKESNVGYTGVRFLVNAGDGQLEPTTWDAEVVLASDVSFLDLNHDPWPDMVLVDTRLQGPAVVVALGQENGLPVQEGRYPLQGPGGLMLGGDVDGDGDLDLVVLEKAYFGGGGGVHVLLNQFAERNTAVTEEWGTQPAGFHLGANYPNPFNPQTWIPLEVSGGDLPVQLCVYNVLGQPIRTLVDGRLGAGPHLVTWDGRDSQGQVVSSGVFFYRLQAGGQQVTGKMVKSE